MNSKPPLRPAVNVSCQMIYRPQFFFMHFVFKDNFWLSGQKVIPLLFCFSIAHEKNCCLNVHLQGFGMQIRSIHISHTPSRYHVMLSRSEINEQVESLHSYASSILTLPSHLIPIPLSSPSDAPSTYSTHLQIFQILLSRQLAI